MPTSTEILPKLQEWLSQSGISAKVAVTGAMTLEIRLETVDLMAQAFPLKVPRPYVKTHATIDEPKRKAPPVEKPVVRKSGFNIVIPQPSGSITPSDMSHLRYLVTNKYSFLSATRTDSKVWETTCREIIWMASNLYHDSHRWDKTWLTKSKEKGGGPTIVKNRFKDIASVLEALEMCLDYVEESFKTGTFWWPSLEKGKIPRRSLLSFIVSTTKANTEWSPFCDVLWEIEKSKALKSVLPESCVKIAEEAIKQSDYLRSLPKSSMDAYWDGVKKFVDWYRDSRAELLKLPQNKVRLADLGMAMTLVKDWNASCSGRVLPAKFIYPGCNVWFRFAQWAKSNRGVDIPMYR